MNEEEVKQLTGLSQDAVKEKISSDGYNELPSSKKRNVLDIMLDVVKEPMFLLLVACGTIYLFLGDLQEALLLLGFVFVVMGITIYQESKTENALEALRDLSSPRALVIREGVQTRIAGREVVTEDVLIIREGDRIPADCLLLWSINLCVDESLLTGESVPVRKSSAKEEVHDGQRPGGDDTPYLFSGTLVVQGQGVARVKSIGSHTEMGKIGKVLQNIETEKTKIQLETDGLVKIVFACAVVMCLIIMVIYGLVKGQWLQGILSGITLAMAMLPEEFPVVLTIFLALGAWRISKKNVLTRKVTSIETLGSTTVLCTDKTGTLTMNQMTIKKIVSQGMSYDVMENLDKELPEEFHQLIEFGILASKKDPFDPMEKALTELGVKALKETEHIHTDWPFIQEYPLSRELLALSHVWETKDGYVISAKGAPEAILSLCHLPADEAAILEQLNAMTSEGLRVLGVARSVFKSKQLPTNQHDFEFEFLGLIGWHDPVRPSVPQAIKECYTAGVRVVMITGDYPATAQCIAKQIGLSNVGEVITGPELDKLPKEELQERIRTVNIFARVVPEQKLLIVEALKANKEVVAMTGDGVNDAPALKAAHIGIAMGERGTDVARESAGLVLLNDDFTSIVDAIRMGRRIYDNLKKAMAYIISVHIPIAGISLIPVLMGWPIVLFPMHIVFLELIIDPACSVVFESEPDEADIMSRPPRNPATKLFENKMLFISLLQGLSALVVVTFVFKFALILGQDEAEARALAFITLIVSNLCLILVNRSWVTSMWKSLRTPNKALKWVFLGAIVFLALVIYIPFLQHMFYFKDMHWNDVLISTAAGFISVLWFELLKKFSAKKS